VPSTQTQASLVKKGQAFVGSGEWLVASGLFNIQGSFIFTLVTPFGISSSLSFLSRVACIVIFGLFILHSSINSKMLCGIFPCIALNFISLKTGKSNGSHFFNPPFGNVPFVVRLTFTFVFFASSRKSSKREYKKGSPMVLGIISFKPSGKNAFTTFSIIAKSISCISSQSSGACLEKHISQL